MARCERWEFPCSIVHGDPHENLTYSYPSDDDDDDDDDDELFLRYG